MTLKKFIIGTLSWKRLFRSLLIVYILTTISAHFLAEKLIFPYHQSSYDNTIFGLKLLNAKGGTKIATKFWQAPDEKALIVYFHGNYIDIGHLDDVALLLNNHNYSILAMDYRGYGLSQGSANEANSYSDAQMVLDYAKGLGYTNQDIIILGRSVGSGIATNLSLENDTKALVLISPFTSTYRVMTTYPIILFDKFNSLDKIKKITTPLFIVHGTNDKVIPAWHSESLIKSHNGEHQRIVIDGAGHNDIWEYAETKFINQLDVFTK